MADAAWADADRRDRPRFVTACFYALGMNAQATLERFTQDYFTVFGTDVAATMAKEARLSNEGRLSAALARVAAETRVDEVILVPAGVDPALASDTARLVEPHTA